MALENINTIGSAKISPPPIKDRIVQNELPTITFIRYLQDLRVSGGDIYKELNKVIDQVNLNIDEINKLQIEVDKIEVGAGLETDGTYIVPTSTNYLNSSTSLANADVKLDTEIKSVQDELDTTQAGAGLNTNGTYNQPSGSNYIDSSTSLANADILLDTQIKINEDDIANLQTKILNKTADYQALEESQLIIVDATTAETNITLPNPINSITDNVSFQIGITKKDTTVNKVVVLPFASELIVGETSQDLRLDGEVLNFITDGTNWYLGN